MGATLRDTGGRSLRHGFSAMGTSGEIVITGGSPRVAVQARARIDDLEGRWSRFRPDSDIARLNRAGGHPVAVAEETILLIERAVAGAKATEGRFDPTVGAAVVAHGYDRTFERARRSAGVVVPVPVVDGAWPAIEIDHLRREVRLPLGTVFDPGAIGKGLAADLVVAELADGVAGILVNLGGDLRFEGASGTEAGWVVSIEDPASSGRELGRMALPAGGVATSSRLRRRWNTAQGPAHHIFDPTTGRPARTEVVAVTVVAAEASWAEVQATSLFLRGPEGLADLDDSVHAVVVLDGGSFVASPGLAGVLR